MPKLIILVYICNVGNPICDASTARVFQVLHAPEGIVICPPNVPIMQSAITLGKGEYLYIKCEKPK